MVLEKTLESPLDSKEIKPVNPKGNQSWIFIGGTDAEAKAPILWWPDAKNWLTGKDPDAGKGGRLEEKGRTEDEMVGLHHWLNGHEFEQALGAGDGQEGLVCCSPWGCKETDMTEWLNWLTDPHYGAETSRLISEHHHPFKLTHKIKHHNHTPGMILNESILEKAMAPHSSTLAWKIPWMEEPGRLQSMGSLRVGHDWATSLSLFTFMHWRRKWQPTSVFLPGESQGRGSLVGCRLWGRTESDTTEMT